MNIVAQMAMKKECRLYRGLLLISKPAICEITKKISDRNAGNSSISERLLEHWRTLVVSHPLEVDSNVLAEVAANIIDWQFVASVALPDFLYHAHLLGFLSRLRMQRLHFR